MMMKLVREHINFKRGLDPKVAMGIGDYHHAADLFPDKKVVYYHKDTDEIESNVKNKKRVYNVTSSLASFLKTKDIIIYIENNQPIGYIDAKAMATYLSSGYGYIIGRRNLYKNLNESLNFQRGINPKVAMGIGMFNRKKHEVEKEILDLLRAKVDDPNYKGKLRNITNVAIDEWVGDNNKWKF